MLTTQEQSAVERAAQHLDEVERKCRAQVDAIRSSLADARALVENAERRRDALQVAAATDATAAQELQQLHREIADAKQRVADLSSALSVGEASAKQTVEAARRDLVAAQLKQLDEELVATAAKFDEGLAMAVAAGEELDSLHERRLALQHIDGSRMGQIESLRGRNRMLAAIPSWLLRIATPIVWPSSHVPLEKSERALLGLPPAPPAKAA